MWFREFRDGGTVLWPIWTLIKRVERKKVQLQRKILSPLGPTKLSAPAGSSRAASREERLVAQGPLPHSTAPATSQSVHIPLTQENVSESNGAFH